MESLERLENEIKQLILDAVALDDLAPEDVDAEQPLFGEGLGLDSIDALEIASALERAYGVKSDGDEAAERERYASVRSLARWVAQNRVGRGATGHGA